MTQYKTILADGAPWPTPPVVVPKAEKPAPKKRVPPPPKDPSKIKRTDEKYSQWADRNLAREFK